MAPPPELAEAVLAFPALPAASEPVMVVHDPDRKQVFLVERRGVLSRFDDQPEAEELTPVLDIGPEVDLRGDAGLVAAALDPDFAQQRPAVPVLHRLRGHLVRSRVTRFRSHDNGASFDPDGRQVLLDIDQGDPWRVHLNADMKFGPDGLLYLGFGDGGPQGDPDGNAQNLDDLRGKILRIDVRGGDGYRIPADNPFLGAGGRPEIFARGLRNPWRFSFDPDDGALWVGDVGFVNWEEIDRIEGGENLGWPMLEGNVCVAPEGCPERAHGPPCRLRARVGRLGGGRVRLPGPGHAPSCRGRYVFGDYMRGRGHGRSPPTGEPELIARTGLRIVSFAEEPDGELLIVDFGSGRLFRLRAQAPHFERWPPPCRPPGASARTTRASRPKVWCRSRCACPSGRTARSSVASWPCPRGSGRRSAPTAASFCPVGSVLAKQFFLGDRLIETRLMMKYREGQWTGRQLRLGRRRLGRPAGRRRGGS